MGPNVSERQYEFAVSFELTNAIGVIPVIPSTNQESKEGWDARFNLGTGWIYHLQYKVASYASRKTSKNPAQWAFHAGPYYRFSLLQDDQGVCAQHERLIALRASEPGVYYCTPLFYKDADYWANAYASAVWTESALLDVNDFLLASYYGRHAITYDAAGLAGIWSEEGNASRRERDVSIRRARQPRTITPDAIRDLALTMIDAVANNPDALPSVPRSGDRGVRESLLEARRPLRGQEPRRARRADQGQLRQALAEVDATTDRESTRAALVRMPSDEVAATIARLGALDLGVATYLEPA
jgi:hypothetical protein